MFVCVHSLRFCNSQFILSQQVVVLLGENGKACCQSGKSICRCVCVSVCVMQICANKIMFPSFCLANLLHQLN